MRHTIKDLAPDQGGRERGKTDARVESVAAAKPARRDGTPQHRQAQYERLCRAVGTGHAPNINGDAHVRLVLMILRQRPLELVGQIILLLMVLMIACTLIHPNSCPFHRLLHPVGHHSL